jgi:hypothetical protein
MRFPSPGDRRRWALGGAVVAVVAAAVAIAALRPFGGELTRAELVAQGDEICAQARNDFEALQRQPPRTAREAADLTRRLIGVAEDELDAIDDLDHPADLDSEIDRYLAARGEGIELLRDGAVAAEAGDQRRYEAAQAELDAGQRFRRRLAREIGFRECSRPIDPG